MRSGVFRRRRSRFALAVVVTLGLGVGANAAIFSVVQGILLRPLPNRDEARLIYIRQSAPGIESPNAFFSVPEIQDIRSRSATLAGLGEFSTLTFTVVGLGDPRQLRAGVVDGGYFEVMGLRPVLGRLINAGDDGPDKPSVAVLTHRFWTSALGADPTVIGRQIRIGSRSAEVIGVLEPSIPYPTETELIANVVTSPHHMSAAMTTDRVHRMTEVFGRLAPSATLQTARAELATIHGAIKSQYKEAYEERARFDISAVPLRDQITSNARPVMLALLASAALVFIGACANIANLMLARATRRQPELAMRAALGASTGTLRRLLLLESTVLAAAGALAGAALAIPAVRVLARYAGRFSVRAQEVSLDERMLLAAMGLSILAAVAFAFIPRLPGSTTSAAALASARTTGRVRGGQRVFAVAQIAASFVLLVGAGLLLKALLTMQATVPGFEMTQVLAVNVPSTPLGRTPEQLRNFYTELRRRAAELPGVRGVAVGSVVPWRDTSTNPAGDFAFAIEGVPRQDGIPDPAANFRSVSPGFFATLGIPMLDGRDFTDDDRAGSERVVIISRSLAGKVLPGQEAFRPPPPVDRRPDSFHRHRHRRPPHHRRRRRHQRRGHRRRTGRDRVSPVRAGSGRRPAVRARRRRSVHPRAVAHQDGPRAVRRSARRTCRDARRCARGCDCADAPQCDGDRRLRDHRAGHRAGRHRRRPGVFGERTHTRVRHPDGDWLAPRRRAARRAR